MFIVFFVMHISLSVKQYDVTQMNKFNQAVTYSLFPDIDVNVHLSPKQWTSKESMHDYFEQKVSKLFEGASYNDESYSYFH